MSNSGEVIEFLKKVTVMMEWDGRQSQFDFIFGIGAEGLSPLEFDLAGKEVGHESEYNLIRGQLDRLFQHLSPPLLLSDVPDAFTLKVRVLGIGKADQKEVIKAMAETSSCGCCGH
jgi:hypothetical protein